MTPIITGNSSPQGININSTADILKPEFKVPVTSQVNGSKTEHFNSEGVNSTNSSFEEIQIFTDTESSAAATIKNNSTLKYGSLGDIIKAKDWKALSEYKCRIKTENPRSFDDSGISSSDKGAKWNSYFNPPPTPVSSPSCCR